MTSEGMVTVGLVDDHAALQEGLEVLLSRRGCRVVGTAATAAEGRRLAVEEKPEVMVVDLRLPGESGTALVRSLVRSAPDVRVVIYTGVVDARELSDALETGAPAIILKPRPLSQLVDAIRSVRRGQRYLDPALRDLLSPRDGSQRVLSPREREILRMLARGLSGEDIARELGLSWETVRTHVRNAMTKLGAKTRTQAVVAAMERDEIDTAG
jgi:DNA-binding NarL/FixJ family response regulator